MTLLWHDIDQTDDSGWLDLRIGKLTGSVAGKVMANAGKAFGPPANQLAVKIAVEQVTGKRSENDSFSNAHTDRGHAQEPIARQLYEAREFVTVSNGGFFEDGNYGLSPDGLVYDHGMIEIKSVISHVHFANIKRGGVDPAYKWQLYFNMFYSGREWIDFVSYCADFPDQTKLYVYRTYIDDIEKEIGMMKQRIDQFFMLVDNTKLIVKGGNHV